MSKFKALIRGEISKVHFAFYLTFTFGSIGVVFGVFGIILSFMGLKDLSELFGLIVLISILSIWVLNKYQD